MCCFFSMFYKSFTPVKPRFNRLRTFIIAASGLLLSCVLVQQVDHRDVFDNEIDIALGTFVAIVLVRAVWKDSRDFVRTRRLSSFIPTITGLVIGVGLVGVLWLYDLRDRSPVRWSVVTTETDFNGVSIDFRVDGSYKLTSWCLGADYYRGRYLVRDSIIVLDQSRIERIIESDQLLMRCDGKAGVGVYQLDGNGQVIRNAVGFRLITKR